MEEIEPKGKSAAHGLTMEEREFFNETTEQRTHP